MIQLNEGKTGETMVQYIDKAEGRIAVISFQDVISMGTGDRIEIEDGVNQMMMTTEDQDKLDNVAGAGVPLSYFKDDDSE